NRWRVARPRQLGSDQRQFRGGAARSRDRYLVGIHIDHRGNRSCARWLVYRACVVEMGVLHQYPFRAGRPDFSLAEGTRKQDRRYWVAPRLGGRDVGRIRLRWNRLCSDSISVHRRRTWWSCPDWAGILGNPLAIAYGPAPDLSFT